VTNNSLPPTTSVVHLSYFLHKKKGMSSFGRPFGSATSFGSVSSSKAPEAPGTRHLGFVAPTVIDEGGGRVIEMHSIACLFPGTPWSVDELRLQDYKALNLSKEATSGFSGGEANIYSPISIE